MNGKTRISRENGSMSKIEAWTYWKPFQAIWYGAWGMLNKSIKGFASWWKNRRRTIVDEHRAHRQLVKDEHEQRRLGDAARPELKAGPSVSQTGSDDLNDHGQLVDADERNANMMDILCT
ncbi:hypothetical protein BKA70DRAFT_1438542 [Coprinopsis sp. MPI-PUGE-AT-0042]|nr:hypothetical protein BKA70DRAFT_1438542 [Coprinopsis sp. MPI-PUGE-AT-0042]